METDMMDAMELTEALAYYMTRNEELEDELNGRRRVERRARADKIKICDRIAELGHVTDEENRRVLKPWYVRCNERWCEALHPDLHKYRARLSDISSRLATCCEDLTGELPIIINCDRSNMYTRQDYEDYGDAVIIEYIFEYPVDTWGIDWNWRPQGDEIRLFKPRQ
jgi:hypothetical protein